MTPERPASAPTRRLFFALWPDEDARSALCAATAKAVRTSGGRPVPAGTLHVTLAFLGSVPTARIPELQHIARERAQALAQDVPLSLTFQRLAHWSRPHLLCALAAEEASGAAGVHFVHQAPTLDSRLNHIMPQVASMGASVSIVDFDHDGWPDIYVTTSKEGAKNALYRNMHDGTFKDVAAEMGVADVNRTGTGV